MGTYTKAALGVHLTYLNGNDDGFCDDLRKKQTAIQAQVMQLLHEAGIAHPICDFDCELDSDIEHATVGHSVLIHDYFKDAKVYHTEAQELSESQRDAMDAAADIVERFLFETDGLDNIKKTLGIGCKERLKRNAEQIIQG